MPPLEPLHDLSGEQIYDLIDNLLYGEEDKRPDPLHVRRKEMKRGSLYKEFLKRGKHGELFVMRDTEGNPLGLIGLHFDTSTHTGAVSLIRTATRGRAQFTIDEKLLIAAERYLRASPRNCTHGVIDVGEVGHHLKMAASHGARARFWEVAENDEAGNESEHIPEVA